MKIDKSIPVPPGKSGVLGRYSETALRMEIGDSVGNLTQGQRNALVAGLKYVYGKKKFTQTMGRKKYRFMNKTSRAVKQDDGTYRVWRVDMPTKYADLKTDQILDFHQQKTGNET
mgnify:FL=1|tara:strand:+ start:1025 stop:1369 length:345 start_codon:yes stop_codon:yes gene_type:complete